MLILCFGGLRAELASWRITAVHAQPPQWWFDVRLGVQLLARCPRLGDCLSLLVSVRVVSHSAV